MQSISTLIFVIIATTLSMGLMIPQIIKVHKNKTKDNWIALDLKYKPVIYCNKHDKGILREIYLDESSYDDLWIDRVIIRR